MRATKASYKQWCGGRRVDSRDDGMEWGGTGTGCGRNDHHSLFGQPRANDVGPWLCTARRHRTLDVGGGVLGRSLG